MARFDALILIRGAGALGSGAAYRLRKAGFPVVMTELANPLMLRGTVSYGACVFYHTVVVEGIMARHASVEQVPEFLAQDIIPILLDGGHDTISSLQPATVIDARNIGTSGDTTIDDAPLVIGLGMGFSAGVNCHAVVGTQRGHDLGRVLWQGNIESNISSRDSEYTVHSPAEGIMMQVAMIGEWVKAGDAITKVGDVPVLAPIDGVLCGLLDNDIQVTTGDKVGIIDPTIRREHCFTISDRFLAIGGGVVEAVLTDIHPAINHRAELVVPTSIRPGISGMDKDS